MGKITCLELLAKLTCQDNCCQEKTVIVKRLIVIIHQTQRLSNDDDNESLAKFLVSNKLCTLFTRIIESLCQHKLFNQTFPQLSPFCPTKMLLRVQLFVFLLVASVM